MAVAQKVSGKYLKFPRVPEKDEIVEFLEVAGFKRCPDGHTSGLLMFRSEELGMPTYSIGSYSLDDLTHWIKFCPDRNTCYMVRTSNGFEKKYSLFGKISDSKCISVSFDKYEDFLGNLIVNYCL